MQPKIFVLARSTGDSNNIANFLEELDAKDWKSDAANDLTLIPEIAGRVCYLSFRRPRPGGNKKYIEHILEVKHFSVIEHVSWTLGITGVSRSLTHELVRHRVGTSYSQQSQRYVDESNCALIEPEIIKNSSDLHSVFDRATKVATSAYKILVEELEKKICPKDASIEERTAARKAARQAARSVLPNATQTRLVWTVNARAARHFLLLRANAHAEQEIRRFANLLYGVLVQEAPELFDDFKLKTLGDGTFELTTTNTEV